MNQFIELVNQNAQFNVSNLEEIKASMGGDGYSWSFANWSIDRALGLHILGDCVPVQIIHGFRHRKASFSLDIV
jgi:hypothetical protein